MPSCVSPSKPVRCRRWTISAAHYLEHMMFNGTERFPANELVKVLSRFGAEFGPDVNAYTSYEETVYELELATDEIEILETGFDVLFEWATAVTLDPAEVDLERCVLVEEWRLRDQGFSGRYHLGVSEYLLDDTAYADRSSLADPEQLETTTLEGLRDFFETWYRTDTMAVIAVGDFDAAAVEQMIVDRFGDLAGPADPEPVPRPTTSVSTEPGFFVLADPEFPETWSELNYPVPLDRNSSSVGAVRQSFALDLAFEILATRLEEDTLLGRTPFFDSGRAANDLGHTARRVSLRGQSPTSSPSLPKRSCSRSSEREHSDSPTKSSIERSKSFVALSNSSSMRGARPRIGCSPPATSSISSQELRSLRPSTNTISINDSSMR